MKKFLGVMLCAALFAVCLSGCSDEGGSVKPTDTPQNTVMTDTPTEEQTATDNPSATDAPINSTNMPDTTDVAVTTAPTGGNGAQ